MPDLVTPEAALAIILQHVISVSAEAVAHGQALGRTLAHDVCSGLNLPPFDNSAMDGYAVRAADVAGASLETPVELPVLETIAAGEMARHELTPGTSARIMTGAPLPPGADAVVMREDTIEAHDSVRILAAAPKGQFIRRAGSDIAQGETALSAGTIVRAAEWGMLASLGLSRVEVARQPRMAIITTGAELVEVDGVLQPGQIHDSNSHTLDALARACGSLVVKKQRVGDDPGVLEAILRECAKNCDVIVTSGGVSAGDFDPVRDVLQAIAHVHFWKIAMKPGKPVMFAGLSRPDGDRKQEVPVFGLPGNPVSVMVAFEQFVRPALLKMQHRRAMRRVMVGAKVDAGFSSPNGKTEFVRALVLPDGDGWKAHLHGEQSSGRLSTMTRANALLVVPPDVTRIQAGQSLAAQMTDWPEVE